MINNFFGGVLMGKILMTGVDGHVGGIAAEEVLKYVAPEKLIFSAPSLAWIKKPKFERWEKLGVEFREAPYDDETKLEKAFADVDRLFMLSTMAIGEKRREQHFNAVQAAKNAGVKHIIYSSFKGAEIAENTPEIAIDHRYTEQLILKSGMNYNFMRNCLYYDNLLTLFVPLAAKLGNVWHANSLGGKAGFVAREDVAKVAAALAAGKGQKNHAYFVTGPDLLSDEDVFNSCETVTGWKCKFDYVSDEELYAFCDSINIPRTMTGDFSKSPVRICGDDIVDNGRSIRLGYFNVVSDTVKELLGREPLSVYDVVKQYKDILPHG